MSGNDWATITRDELRALRVRLDTAEAEVARVNGMRCESCAHRRCSVLVTWCDLVDRPCEMVGFTCGAWEKRDEQPEMERTHAGVDWSKVPEVMSPSEYTVRDDDE